MQTVSFLTHCITPSSYAMSRHIALVLLKLFKLAKTGDVPIIGSAIISPADMLLLLYQQSVQLAQRANISTNYSVCENNFI